MLPDEVREREALATVCGYVLKIGPLAFKDESKFGYTGAWCKEKIGFYLGDMQEVVLKSKVEKYEY